VLFHKIKLKPFLGLLNAWQLHRRTMTVATDFDPDVVHYTSPISPVLPYFRLSGRAVVIGPLNGNVAHPPAFRDREPRGKLIGRWILAPLQAVLGQLFRGKREALLLVSGGERTVRALELGGCSRDRMVATLDCGIPDSLVDRTRITHDGVNRRFVHLGRLVAYKGCDLAIRAVAAADPGTTLDIIGDGEERAALEALVCDLSIEDRVTFMGWLPAGEALYDRLADYRGLVLPSLAEANGIAFQEAMMLGLPIICVDWAGPKELLSSEHAIMVAPTGQDEVVAGVAAAMNELGSDGDRAEALAARAHRRAMDLGFRWRDLLGRWQDVYRRAIAQATAG
jgi:glycosyltransferase involved in cell wall biosynthesis